MIVIMVANFLIWAGVGWRLSERRDYLTIMLVVVGILTLTFAHSLAP